MPTSTKPTPFPHEIFLSRGFEPTPRNHLGEVLHTLCSAVALGLFVVGGAMVCGVFS